MMNLLSTQGDCIKIYPNPFKSSVAVSFTNPDNISKIGIYDISGNLIACPGKVAGRKYMCDGTGLTAGIYLVQVKAGEKQYTRRIFFMR